MASTLASKFLYRQKSRTNNVHGNHRRCAKSAHSLSPRDQGFYVKQRIVASQRKPYSASHSEPQSRITAALS